jgi:CHAT domain-containing protein
MLIERAGSAGMIHLAAHGRFNASGPLESFIALAPDSIKQPDGRLTVREVYSTLRLPQTDPVVLSACQTNVGEVSDVDEVVGLTRAFIFSRTPSVIATLWSVDDRATELLSERRSHLVASRVYPRSRLLCSALPHPSRHYHNGQ